MSTTTDPIALLKQHAAAELTHNVKAVSDVIHEDAPPLITLRHSVTHITLPKPVGIAVGLEVVTIDRIIVESVHEGRHDDDPRVTITGRPVERKKENIRLPAQVGGMLRQFLPTDQW